MTTSAAWPKRQFRCRLEELGPLARLTYARYLKHRTDFLDATTDFGDAFETEFMKRSEAFEKLVPTRQRQLTAKEEAERLNAAAKQLRHPLNLLDIQVGSAGRAGLLTVTVKDFGLGRVRNEISTRDLEGLDGALGDLIKLVEVNQQALTDKGMKPATLQALKDARQSLGEDSTEQDSDRLDSVELTEENVKAGNALWELVAEILRVGRLLYKETNPKRAKGYTMARLKRLMRSANEGGKEPPVEGDDDAPENPA